MSLSRAVLPATLLALVAGCAPQNAKLTSGGYTAFLASQTSTSVLKGTVDVDPDTDAVQGDWKNTFNLDCRYFDTKADETALRLQNSILSPDDCDALYDIGTSTNSGLPTLQETWIVEDGYYAVQEDWDPWRGEAVITSEGDLQLAFHQHIPGGEDFRFLFVIDPAFQPTTCHAEPDGKATTSFLDGDWLEEWSKNMEKVVNEHPDEPSYDAFKQFEGGTLYFPNAYSYQFNPDDPNTFDNPYWTLPDEWLAGTTSGKFSEEYFSERTIRYGEPIMYAAYEATEDQTDPVVAVQNVWYCDQTAGAQGTWPLTDDCTNLVPGKSKWTTMTELVAHAEDVADETEGELTEIQVPMRPIVEGNLWRKPDGQPPGLDGWAEMDYNWIVVDKDSDISPGGHVSGAFNLVMDGDTSTSRYFFNGTFEVDHIKRDRWVNQDIQAIQLSNGAEQSCF